MAARVAKLCCLFLDRNGLFSPLFLSKWFSKNRIVIAPMARYSARERLGPDWHLIRLGSLSGAGLKERTIVP